MRDVGFNMLKFVRYLYGAEVGLGKMDQRCADQIERDLRLQYLAGWGINSQMADVLYREMLSFRQPPANIFAGSSTKVSDVIGSMTGGRR